jgi:hypothetical protein
MATKRKTNRKPAAKARPKKAAPVKAKPARKATPSAPAGENREVHYTDLRKVMLANALKRLR